jgi:hypothetical protein
MMAKIEYRGEKIRAEMKAIQAKTRTMRDKRMGDNVKAC